MGASLREAWLWLLLAFLLGLAIGYFVRRRPSRAHATAGSTDTTRIAALEAQYEAHLEDRSLAPLTPAAVGVSAVRVSAIGVSALGISALGVSALGVSALAASAPATVVVPAKKTAARVLAATAPAAARVLAATAPAAARVLAATAPAAARVLAATAPAAKPARRRQASTKQAAKAAVLDLAVAKTALGVTVKLDDLKLIEGIGPRIETLFKADGITSWRELSKANVERLQGVLDAAGPRYKVHNPGSWPRQASLLADGKWAEFKALTDKLKGGR
ncbi:hypothetical protein [Demequina lutea]|uniref:Putative flap endonuclease-1-like 5' DNA nuclease n=1 Tax=Demequina lutea TaxID=431489 RepID=A0A7Y9Z9N8_9MICO|nr:hypothetical protein [Demequina lutea]NYI40820.1 putative flap endonuclease-1-like 5' DNA nuclease [Demequina lutea]